MPVSGGVIAWNYLTPPECSQPGEIGIERTHCQAYMNQALMEKFPVQEMVFETATGKWAAGVVNDPEPGSPLSPYPDMVLFDLEFTETNTAGSLRRLRLWTSYARLCNEPDYPTLLKERVFEWLSLSQAISGEIWFIAN